MAGKPSPVTSSVLAWAVEEDGRDLRSLAEALDTDPDTLTSWVVGEERPLQGQVTKLAEVLKRPRALFFLPRPPVAATLPPSFRHPPGEQGQVSAAARRKVRQARRVQQAVSWALRDDPVVEVPLAAVSTDAEQAGVRARTWLGITDAEQQGWRDDYAALRAWRQALQQRDVLVFALDIGRNDVQGFSAWDEHAPLVVINTRRVTPAARSYTLMHELGHLLLRQDAACIEAGPSGESAVGVERWCERFAAAALMPEAVVRTWAVREKLSTASADLVDVKTMMTRFRVSARAAALRLIALGYAQRDLYAEVMRVFVPQSPSDKEDSSFFSPARPVLRQRQYGDRVLRTVLNDLPPRDALSILHLEVADARRLAETVPGVREI